MSKSRKPDDALFELQRSPASFRKAIYIDTDVGPRLLDDCLDDWQRKDFVAVDSGWRRVVGQTVDGGYQRAWLERPRGHAKTLDLGVMATWALFASRRRLSGVAAAGDQEQARLLRDAIGRLIYVNPWLGNMLEVQSYRVINVRTESTLEILTSDAPTSYGLTPDFLILDEVTHWKKRDLWDSLISSAAKRANCVVVVITNAGMIDDWQWTAREAIRTDPSWYFSRIDGVKASWIAPERLAEQERLLPPVAYARLWLNQWSTGGGDALTRDLIEAAFKSDLQPLPRKLPGWECVGGLDLGVSRDSSAICILAVRKGSAFDDERGAHGRIRLAYTKIFKPTKGRKVELQDIEDLLLALHEAYGFAQIAFDPWQATHMSQRLVLNQLPMFEVQPTGKNLQAIATALIEAFSDRRVDLFPEPELQRDLIRLRIEERAYGFRLVSPRDEHGHGDLGTAFSLAMLAAREVAGVIPPPCGVIALGPEFSAYSRNDPMEQYIAEGPSDDGHENLAQILDALSGGARGNNSFL